MRIKRKMEKVVHTISREALSTRIFSFSSPGTKNPEINNQDILLVYQTHACTVYQTNLLLSRSLDWGDGNSPLDHLFPACPSDHPQPSTATNEIVLHWKIFAAVHEDIDNGARLGAGTKET